MNLTLTRTPTGHVKDASVPSFLALSPILHLASVRKVADELIHIKPAMTNHVTFVRNACVLTRAMDFLKSVIFKPPWRCV